MSSAKGWHSCCERSCSLLPILWPPHSHGWQLHVPAQSMPDTQWPQSGRVEVLGHTFLWANSARWWDGQQVMWETTSNPWSAHWLMDSKWGLQIQAMVELQHMNWSSLQSALTVWACLTLKLLSLFIPRLATGLGSALWARFQSQDQD